MPAPVVIAALTGSHHYQAVPRVASLKVGEGIRPVREPNNRFDGNAIGVVTKEDQYIGHLDAGSAAILAPWMDKGVIYTGTIVTEADVRTHRGRRYVKRESVNIKCVPIPLPVVSRQLETVA